MTSAHAALGGKEQAMGNMVVAPPSTALIVPGKVRGDRPRVQVGGRAYAGPWRGRIDTLSLGLRTIRVESRGCPASSGVMVDVVGVCQVKVAGYREDEGSVLRQDDNAIRLAAQHFLGASDESIADAVRATLEGHQRSIIAALSVEDIYGNVKAFAAQVRGQVAKDLRGMGLDVVSYTISSVKDEDNYLASLGAAQTALVKREAAEGRAKHSEAQRSAAKREELRAATCSNNWKQQADRSNAALAVAQVSAQQSVSKAEARAKHAMVVASEELKEGLLVVDVGERQALAEVNVVIERLRAEHKSRSLKIETEARAQADLILNEVDAESRQIRVKTEQHNTAIQQHRTEAQCFRSRALAEAKADAADASERAAAATVRLAAEAMLYETQCHGKGLQEVQRAQADAALLRGRAEAEVCEALAAVEADRLEQMAEIYRSFGTGAQKLYHIKQLPDVAARVASAMQVDDCHFLFIARKAGAARRSIACGQRGRSCSSRGLSSHCISRGAHCASVQLVATCMRPTTQLLRNVHSIVPIGDAGNAPHHRDGKTAESRTVHDLSDRPLPSLRRCSSLPNL